MELASLYERAHRLDEAQEMIERTVRSGYDFPLVWLVRGRIERRRKQANRAEATFRALVARAGPDSEWACQAWGELALMKDAQGDFAGAVEAIEQCKRSQRAREAPHWAASEKVHALMREMVARITRDDLQRWRDASAGMDPRRVALLTGFPRSGTTLLEQLLDAHPDLVSSEERDLFRLLIHTVSGIGPKTALNVLSGISVTAFRGAVANGDLKSLSKISGVGRKTAERIVVELKDKIGMAGAWEAASAKHGLSADEQRINDAVLALVALGFKQVDAHDAVRGAQAVLGTQATVEELVRVCLKKGA